MEAFLALRSIEDGDRAVASRSDRLRADRGPARGGGARCAGATLAAVCDVAPNAPRRSPDRLGGVEVFDRLDATARSWRRGRGDRGDARPPARRGRPDRDRGGLSCLLREAPGDHLADAARLVEAAASRGVTLGVDHNRRFGFGYRVALPARGREAGRRAAGRFPRPRPAPAARGRAGPRGDPHDPVDPPPRPGPMVRRRGRVDHGAVRPRRRPRPALAPRRRADPRFRQRRARSDRGRLPRPPDAHHRAPPRSSAAWVRSASTTSPGRRPSGPTTPTAAKSSSPPRSAMPGSSTRPSASTFARSSLASRPAGPCPSRESMDSAAWSWWRPRCDRTPRAETSL